MILILPTTLISIFLYFLKYNNSVRLALINSFLILSALIFLITEFLSLFNYITIVSIFLTYLFLAIVFFYFSPKFKFPKLKFDSFDKIILIAIFFISSTTLIIAIIAPPNNWDSMTYHMSRVGYWIQNKGIHFFNTNNPRQNILSPFSEYVILHFQILSGSDIFANLVQWISLIISMTTISLICEQFGLNKRLQLISAFFICSLPIVVLQSSSTQNDIVVSTFILLFYYYQVILVKKHSNTIMYFSGLSLGLGILTKGTSYILLFAIGITYFVYSILNKNWKIKAVIISRYGIILFIGLLINLPHYLRNYIAHNDILGLNIFPSLTNELFSFGTIFSNLIRHIAYQLGSNINLINWYIYSFVKILLGDSISDPRTSFLDRDFRPPFLSFSEDHAGNVIHTIFFIIIFLASIVLIKKFKKIQITSLFIAVISIFLYCLLLKWQPWTNKVLPLFIITTPFIMIVIGYIFNKKIPRRSIYFFLVIMFLGTLPYLFYNESRPLLPFNNQSILFQNRMAGYFNNQPELFKQYKKIIYNIDNNKNSNNISIALHIGGDSWDYPFWVMLNQKFSSSPPYLFHLMKEDISAIEKSNLYPMYIIFENHLFKNFEKIKKSYHIVESAKNFSLMKINKNQ